MPNYNGPIEARNALMDYIYDREEALPDDVRETLRDYIKLASPIEMIKQTIILVYDRLIDCPKGLRQWAADAAFLCNAFGISGISDDMIETLKP